MLWRTLAAHADGDYFGLARLVVVDWGELEHGWGRYRGRAGHAPGVEESETR